MKRKNISSGAPWEDIVGYSRAVRVGNIIEITGTVAVRDGEVVGLDDPYKQTICILEIIETALEEADATMSDVVRTRMFVTDITHWKEIGKAHGEFFNDIRPATTMIEVSALIQPEFLVEIEATAIIQG